MEFLNLLESAMEDMEIDTADEIIKQIEKCMESKDK